MARTLSVEIIGDASSLRKAVGQAESSGSKLGGTFGKLAKGAALAGGAAGIGALVYGLKTGIGEFMQSQKVTAQTNAVLKSTGSIANVTAEQVGNLATSIMKKTGIDDEAIASGENMLLTFTNIRNEVGKGNDIFNQSTRILADMSTALGTDMNKSAIQLGKALNDPIKGISALSRVGVTFTADQKEMVKGWVEHGETVRAQKFILAELNKEFGGSAEAMGKTLPGQINIVREQFNNWAGEMVARLIPVLQNLVAWIRENWPEISATIKRVWSRDIQPTLESMIILVVEVVQTIRRHWGTIGPIVEDVAKIIERIAQQIANALQLVTALLRGDWSAAWGELKQMVSNALGLVRDVITLQAGILVAALKALGTALKNALVEGLKGIGNAAWEVINNIGEAIANQATAITGWGTGIGTKIKNGVTGALPGIGSAAWDVINNIGQWITDKATAIAGWGKSIGEGIVGGIKAAMSGVAGAVGGAASAIAATIGTAVKSLLNSIIDRINSLLEFTIKGPGPLPDFKVNPPDIPHLAQGIRNFAGGLAVVGERGPELVGLPRGSSVTPNYRPGGETVIHNILQLDGKTVYESWERQRSHDLMRNGSGVVG